jgi:hypothetical protein
MTLDTGRPASSDPASIQIWMIQMRSGARHGNELRNRN